MTYQGERARPLASEAGRFFVVSKVRIGPDGHVSDVLWGEVDAGSNRDVGARVEARAAEVVDAIHDGARVAAVFAAEDHLPERAFVIVEHEDGRECIAFDATSSPGRDLADMASLGQVKAATVEPQVPAEVPPAGVRAQTFAVSKVRLDSGGRVTAVLWGKVDMRRNAWTGPETVVDVAEVVKALDGGHTVFALFPSAGGHLAERRFVSVDYDDGRKAIVLDGSATHEREIHDMDRLA